MPKTSTELPIDNTTVRFRITGDKHMHAGTYTSEKGFEVCNSFMCYTMDEVDYWRYEDVSYAQAAGRAKRS